MAARTERTIRVVIVDDHPMVRDGTAAFLNTLSDINVVGVAEDAASALDEVRRRRPDALLLDLRLPDMNGVELARQVRSEQPKVALVVMSGYDYIAYRRELARMGVQNVLSKSSTGSEIANALRAATRRKRKKEEDPEAEEDEEDGAPELRPEDLTVREAQVLEMLAAGRRNPEIAAALSVSVKTIEFHVGNLMGKLHARTRVQAVMRAQDLGLIRPDLLPPEGRSIGA